MIASSVFTSKCSLIIGKLCLIIIFLDACHHFFMTAGYSDSNFGSQRVETVYEFSILPIIKVCTPTLNVSVLGS